MELRIRCVRVNSYASVVRIEDCRYPWLQILGPNGLPTRRDLKLADASGMLKHGARGLEQLLAAIVDTEHIAQVLLQFNNRICWFGWEIKRLEPV
jgi:hypothetical protein